MDPLNNNNSSFLPNINSKFYTTVKYIPVISTVVFIWKCFELKNQIMRIKPEEYSAPVFPQLLATPLNGTLEKVTENLKEFNTLKSMFSHSEMTLAIISGTACSLAPAIGISLGLLTITLIAMKITSYLKNHSDALHHVKNNLNLNAHSLSHLHLN